MKLQVNEITPYLPYSVKALIPESNKKGCKKKVIGTVSGIYADATIVCWDTNNVTPNRFKLILRPLSDLYFNTLQGCEIGDEFSELEWDAFVSCFMSGITPDTRFDHVAYSQAQLLFKHHFDLFGLIKRGLAVDYSLINK